MRLSNHRLCMLFIHLLIGMLLIMPLAAPFATSLDLPAPIGTAIAPAPALAQSGTIYYVRPAPVGNDSNSGLAWNTAFATLQKALATATTGDQIWVAAGTYYPDEGPSQTNDDPTSTFSLKNGVAIYGGFAGGEANLGDRNVAAMPRPLFAVFGSLIRRLRYVPTTRARSAVSRCAAA